MAPKNILQLQAFFRQCWLKGAIVLGLVLGFGEIQEAAAQQNGTTVTYGRSRVQFKSFFWQYYRYQNFDLYYYEGGRELALHAAKVADPVIQELQQRLNTRQEGRFQFLVYTSEADAAQTNIGQGLEQTNTGGVTALPNNKVLLAFDGDREHFAQAIRREVGRVLITDLLYGGNLQEMIQSNSLMFLPDWYVPGMLEWLSTGWTREADGEMRALAQAGKLTKFNRFQAYHPGLAGRSFWHFIAETYGPDAPGNLIYLTRVNRDYQAALEFVTGEKSKVVLRNWRTYYQGLYGTPTYDGKGDNEAQIALPGRIFLPAKPKSRISQLRISPNARKATYAVTKSGITRIYIYDFEKRTSDEIYRYGQKYETQASRVPYPILAWHPDSRQLGWFYKDQAKLRFVLYRPDQKDKKRRFLRNQVQIVDDVTGADFLEDGSSLVLSASRGGQADLFLFRTTARTPQPLTADGYDDAHPRFVPADPYNPQLPARVLFSSNRPLDTLILRPGSDTLSPLAQHDIFALYYKERPLRIERLIATEADERQPIVLSPDKFAYLSAANGLWNRYQGEFIPITRDIVTRLGDSLVIERVARDSAVGKPVTDLPVNILYQEAAPNLPYIVSGVQSGVGMVFCVDSAAGRSQSLQPIGYTPKPTRTEERLRAARLKAPPAPRFLSLDRVIPNANLSASGSGTSPTAPASSVSSSSSTSPETTPLSDSIAVKAVVDSPVKGAAATRPRRPFYQVQTDLQDFVSKDPLLWRDSTGAVANAGAVNNANSVDSTQPAPADSSDSDSAFAAQPIDQFDTEMVSDTLGNGEVYLRPRASYDPALESDPAARTAADGKGGRNLLKARIYTPQFASNYVVSQLDNQLIFPTYQRFSGLRFNAFNPGLNGFFKMGASDVMENYRFTGGFRSNFSFNSSEYFLQYEALKKRVDKSILIYQQTRRTTVGDNRPLRITTQVFQLGLTYPFSRQARLQFFVLGRRDINTQQATSPILLAAPATDEYWSTLMAEYVFDNTIERGPNIRFGTRYKAYLHEMRQVDTLGARTFVFGLDYRRYNRITGQIVWANRISLAESFGPQRIAYYLGGVDGWLAPRIDSTVQLPTTVNYQFEALGTPLRGFDRNARNGSSFFVINSELRIPLVGSLIRTPLGSDFLASFQVVPFFDIGTAWTGLLPSAKSNSFNTQVFQNPVVRVEVTNNRQLLVYGFGTGLRTRLFGYFVRGDVAWGYQDQNFTPAQYYLSLGLDF